MAWFWEKKKVGKGPDYAHIDSAEKAQQLVSRGELVTILLMPEAFGGEAFPANIVYVPPFAAHVKTSTDENIIRPLAEEGKIKRYSAKAEYSGKSFVPIALKLVASDPGSFTYDIAIWGEALGRGGTD